MTNGGRAFSIILVCTLSGCGGESSGGPNGGTGGSSSGGTSGSSSGGSSTGGSSTGGTSTGGADGGVGTVQCGPSLVCDATSVCIVDETAPSCSPKMDDASTCPPGTSESQCGGIGYPCCCEPPPPDQYRCESAAGCPPTPDCSCLGDICMAGQMCMGVGGKDREFHCTDMPVP